MWRGVFTIVYYIFILQLSHTINMIVLTNISLLKKKIYKKISWNFHVSIVK